MPRYFFTLFVIFALFVTGCHDAQPDAKAGGKPAWISMPYMDGKKGYVGIAPYDYFYGPAKQKEVAMHYALDGLSRQLGVKVETVSRMQTSANNSDSQMNYRSSSSHASNNKVLAHIEDTWTDPHTKELYVWMVLDQ